MPQLDSKDLGPAISASISLRSILPRRAALLSALLIGSLAKPSAAAVSIDSCACQPPPDCKNVCPNGGSPRGDGTQACDCVEDPPPRALSAIDGGDASNTVHWAGRSLRLNHNTSATKVLVLSGNNVDYVKASEVANSLTPVTTAGSAGPTASKTISGGGTFQVPYFSVNSRGQITGYTTRTMTFKSSSSTVVSSTDTFSSIPSQEEVAAAQPMMVASADSAPETSTYSNYSNYSNYGAYSDYSNVLLTNCCGDTEVA